MRTHYNDNHDGLIEYTNLGMQNCIQHILESTAIQSYTSVDYLKESDNNYHQVLIKNLYDPQSHFYIISNTVLYYDYYYYAHTPQYFCRLACCHNAGTLTRVPTPVHRASHLTIIILALVILRCPTPARVDKEKIK